MKKVLHIKATLLIGGAERLMAEMLPLMNKEIEVALLINLRVDNAFSQMLQKGRVTIYTLDYPKLYSPWNIIKLVRWLRQYDLIHVHLFPSLYFVAIANVFAHKPLVYTEHSTFNKRRGKWYMQPIEKWMYGQYKKIISISQLTEVNLKKWIGASSDDPRFVIVNNGINLGEFSNVKHEKLYPHTLIMIGRFYLAKDQATIIRAMKLLAEDVHLILVGDGVGREKCQLLTAELGLQKRVHFVGIQSDVPSWIAKADIGIHSSHWEGFGLTAVEMMAGGLPVIASDVDGLREVVQGAGEIFPCGDYKRLAEIVTHLLDDKDYYEQVKNRCQKRAEEYDIQTMTKAYLNVYREVLGDGHQNNG